MNSIGLERVKYIPKELSSGVLYVSDEYAVAAHLCACGCGSKVSVPLGPAEWTFSESQGLPTLRPSIGNWQLPCKSHYVITNGRILWAGKWSEGQVKAGRAAEERRRQAHYASLEPKQGFWKHLWNWLHKTFWW
jgi:hypothetical protein